MEKSFKEAFYIVAGLVVSAILVAMSAVFTNEARSVENREAENKAFYRELNAEREWRRYTGYTGNNSGADVVDFIARHKDVCDIVIRDIGLSSNQKLAPYLTNGLFILGLSDAKNVPDNFWDATFIYDILFAETETRSIRRHCFMTANCRRVWEPQ